jgi:hypothetical protein
VQSGNLCQGNLIVWYKVFSHGWGSVFIKRIVSRDVILVGMS